VNSFSFKQFLSTKWPLALLLSAVTLICYWFALKFEIFEGGSDNYIHYRVSRYAFKYPELFLDHWGKPIFTLLSAPFVQFGFKGFIFFNVLCGVLASFFTWKVAQRLKLSYAWATMVMVMSMPVYFIMMASAMTEVLFSLVLILSIYFILKERYILAAILFSALFLIRTEGYILYPFIAFVFILKRQWLAIPFLGFFFLIYSFIGFIYFGDFLWLINQIPYGDTSELYGTGELLFFVKQYEIIFGKWISFLIFIGGITVLVQALQMLFKEKKLKIDFILIEVLLLVYFAAHSYVWWSGTGASAGLVRVMAAIVPLAAITALRSIDFYSKKIPLPQVFTKYIVVLFCIFIIKVPFKVNPIPFKYGEREKTIVAGVEWMKASKYADSKVYFYEPLIYFLLDRDPFDHSVIKEIIDDREYPENVTKPGELIFYDTHFGPNEGRLPLNKLMDNPRFLLVNYFEPIEPFIIMDKYFYSLYIFKRVNENSKNNHELLKQFIEKKSSITLWKKVIKKDKEIKQDEEFTTIIEFPASEMEDIGETEILSVEMEYVFKPFALGMDKLLVISIENGKETLLYKAEPLLIHESNDTEKVTSNIVLSKKLGGNETIKIYIWSKSLQPGIIKKLNVYKINKTY
jgi:hypothetical protein